MDCIFLKNFKKILHSNIDKIAILVIIMSISLFQITFYQETFSIYEKILTSRQNLCKNIFEKELTSQNFCHF